MEFAEMIQIVHEYRHAMYTTHDKSTVFLLAMPRQRYLDAVETWPQLQYGDAAKDSHLDVHLIAAADVVDMTRKDMAERQSLLIDGRFVPVIFTDEE